MAEAQKRKREADGVELQSFKKTKGRDHQNQRETALSSTAQNATSIITTESVDLTEAEKAKKAKKVAKRLQKREKKRRVKEVAPQELQESALLAVHPKLVRNPGEAANGVSPEGTVNGTIVIDGETQPDPDLRQKRRRRRPRSNRTESAKNDPADIVSTAATRSGPQGTGSGRQELLDILGDAKWSMSTPIAGRYMNLDPIFTPDEQYVIFGTEVTLSIFSTESSLHLRSLQIDHNEGVIVSYSLSPSDPNNIYIATSTGLVTKWSITSGARLNHFRAEHVLDLAASNNRASDKLSGDVVFTVERFKNSSKVILHQAGSQLNHTLLTCDSRIRNIKVVDHGRILMLTGMNSFLLGQAKHGPEADPSTFEYSWREVECAEPIMSLAGSPKVRKVGKTGETKEILDVAVAGLKGCIYVYEDVLRSSRSGGFKPRELHWHREAVHAVTWSKDGNYIISGGRETVLVLWQLETGKKQFLPNLESPIEKITVSPTGTSYAIKLGDNSVMVLSTSELKPTASIIGIQASASLTRDQELPMLPTVDLMSQLRNIGLIRQTPICIDSKRPSTLLIGVPPHQGFDLSSASAPAPYLQTFDITAERHVSRQALLRNNATNPNLGPEGNRIQDPDLQHVQTSSNGSWLATVDEWFPPGQDTEDLLITGLDPDAALANLKEVHLQFWRWNENDHGWMLNSRINSPHEFHNGRLAGSVLHLIADPSSERFATIGEDFTVKIWAMRSNKSDMKKVRKEDRVVDTWWSVEHTIPLKQLDVPDLVVDTNIPHAKLAYSNDGTVLVANDSTTDMVHFIDAANGRLYETRTGLLPGSNAIESIAIMGKLLICATNTALSLTDLTTFQLQEYTTLSSTVLDRRSALPGFHSPKAQLAVNLSTSTFAIATAEPLHGEKFSRVNPLLNFRFRVRVFSTSASVLADVALPHGIMALLSAGGVQDELSADGNDDVTGERTGYIVLDVGAQIRTIKPKVVQSVTAQQANQPGTDLQSVLVDEEAMSEEGVDVMSDTNVLTRYADDRQVVRPQRLAEIFEYPSHAMPSIVDMFKQVVSLFAGGSATDHSKPLPRLPPPRDVGQDNLDRFKDQDDMEVN